MDMVWNYQTENNKKEKILTMTSKHKNLLLLSLIITFAVNLTAQDWYQWRGENRNGIYKESNLNLNWSEKKPALLWTFEQAGAGYSSPVIVENILYCHGGTNSKDFAFALDTKSGTLKWKQILGNLYLQDRGNGPRGTITVDGNKLYLIRGGGQIHCLSTDDGKMLWEKDFQKDFGGSLMSGWGFSESPLIDGDLVICSPGGEKGSIIALDKNSGEVVWRCSELTDKSGYSSAIVADVDGIRQYVQLTEKGIAGVEAKTGRLLWKHDIEGFRVAIIPTPIFHDNKVYITVGYNVGSVLIGLSRDGDNIKSEIIYANKNLVNQHGGAVLVNGYVYGFSDAHGWVCQDFKSGENIWTHRVNDVAKGAVLAVNDKLLLLNERNGLVTIIEASPKGWKEFGRMEFPKRSKEASAQDKMVWAHPVVSNGKLYLRDHEFLFCFDLKLNF